MTAKEMYKKYENDPEYVEGLLQTNFLAQLFEYMEEHHISNAKLAKQMHVSRKYVKDIFEGYTKVTLRIMAEISIALKVEWKYQFLPRKEREINDKIK